MSVVIWTPIERVLNLLTVFIAFVGGLGYIRRSKERTNQNEKQILYGLALILIFFSIGILFMYVARFYAEGSFNGQAYVGTFNEDKTPAFQLIGMGHIFWDLGLVIFVIEIERTIKQTKYILTYLSLACYILSELSYWTGFRGIYFIGTGILLVIFLVAILYLLKFSVRIHNLFIFMMTGFLYGYIGGSMQTPEAIEVNIYPLEFPFVLLLIGYSIVVAPAYINVDKILNTNSKYIWLIFAGAVILGLSVGIELIILSRSVNFLVQIVVTLVLLSIIIYIFIQRKTVSKNQTSSFTSTISPSESTDYIDFVSVFSRPKTVTEEEISISKEKKICLLCKGKVSKFNFLCNCGAFYCEKCAKALITLENACWACGMAIDETKPVKPFQEEAEKIDISIEEKDGKKKK